MVSSFYMSGYRDWGAAGGMLEEGSKAVSGLSTVPFLIAFAFSALRWACAGFTDFSFGILKVVNKQSGLGELWHSAFADSEIRG